MEPKEIIGLFSARMRKRLRFSYDFKYQKLMDKIEKAKRECIPGEKPKPVNTHLRDAIIMPCMVGGIVGIYSGKEFREIEIKFDMIGTYLGEYAYTYKPNCHYRPSVGATKGSSITNKK